MDVIWSATIATTVATGMRKPRMHGMPPITSGSMVTRVTRMSIRLAGDSTLGRFSTSRLGLSSAKSKPEGDFGTACGAVSGGDAGVVALAEGVDDGQSKPGAAGGARGVGGFRESRADCGEQFGVASWTPQGEFVEPFRGGVQGDFCCLADEFTSARCGFGQYHEMRLVA